MEIAVLGSEKPAFSDSFFFAWYLRGGPRDQGVRDLA
jgi:hypothetical protein